MAGPAALRLAGGPVAPTRYWRRGRSAPERRNEALASPTWPLVIPTMAVVRVPAQLAAALLDQLYGVLCPHASVSPRYESPPPPLIAHRPAPDPLHGPYF